ncbi:hypothetical protein ACQY0O_004912 [Thecaphora frezii]
MSRLRPITPLAPASVIARRFLVLLPLLPFLLLPPASALLFDTGFDPPTPPKTGSHPPFRLSQTASRSQPRPVPPASDGSLVSTFSDAISVPPGCRRSTDFFAQICSNTGEPQSSHRSGIQGEFLICDLPSPEPLVADQHHPDGAQPRTRAIAISGTLTFTEDGHNGHLGQEASHIAGADPASPQAPLPALDETYPAPGAEGFWRQHNGRHEWHPSRPDPVAPASLHSGSRPVGPSEGHVPPDQHRAGHGSPPHSADQAQIKAYDAWSAEQEGQGFLSFSEWKEKYVDSVREKDRARKEADAEKARAKAKKNRKTKEASAAATERAQQEPSSSADPSEHAANATHGTSQASSAPIDPPATRAGSGTTGNDSVHQRTDASSPHHAPATATSSNVADGSSGTLTQRSDEKDSAIDGGGTAQDSETPLAEHEGRAAGGSKDNSADSVSRGSAGSDAASQLGALKHRWNFASFDCAAVVHRTNPSAKFASAILSEKKDRYMLSPCPRKGSSKLEDGQFVIVELCDEIKIDTLVLANYEFFSSMFKKFRVTAAQQLKGREDDWKELGTFRARNIRGLQVFNLPSTPASRGFYRYVRIDFLEHYGSEYYCPVSLLRVYGLTQMDDYYQIRDQEEMDKLSDESETGVEEEEDEIDDEGQANNASTEVQEAFTGAAAGDRRNRSSLEEVKMRDEDVWRKHEKLFRERLEHERATDVNGAPGPPLLSDEVETSNRTSTSVDPPYRPLRPRASNLSKNDPRARSAQDSEKAQEGHQSSDHSCGACDRGDVGVDFNELLANHATCARRPSTARMINLKDSGSASRMTAGRGSYRTAPEDATYEVEPGPNRTARRTPPSDSVEHRQDAPPKNHAKVPSGSSATGQQAPHAPPSTSSSGGSESIYRAIARRLNALEANATLSLNYIEHSGQMLREVFARMEKRQDERMSDMLRSLNASNWRQIEALKRRQQVDLQRAIFEFDVHRQQAEVERVALMGQVDALANEVLLEKRLGIAQLVLLFSLFVFMGLTRGSRAAPFIHSSIARISGTPGPRSRQSAPRQERKTPSTIETGPRAGEAPKPTVASPKGNDVPAKSRADPFAEGTARGTDDRTSHVRRKSSLDRSVLSDAKLGSPIKPATRSQPIAKPSRVGGGIDRSVALVGSLSTRPRTLHPPNGPLGLPSPIPRRRKAQIKLLQQIKALSLLIEATEQGPASSTCPDCRRHFAGVIGTGDGAKTKSADQVDDGRARPVKPNGTASVANGRRSSVPTAGDVGHARSVPASSWSHQPSKQLPLPTDRQYRRYPHELPYQAPTRLYGGISKPKHTRLPFHCDNDDAAGLSSDWTERSEDQSEANGFSEDDDVQSLAELGIADGSLTRSPFAEAMTQGPPKDQGVKSIDVAATQALSPTEIAPPLTPHGRPAAAGIGAYQPDPLPMPQPGASHGAPHGAPTLRMNTSGLSSHGNDQSHLTPLSSRYYTRAPAESDSDSEGGAWQRVMPRRSASSSMSRKSRVSTPETSIGAKPIAAGGGGREGQSSFLRRLAASTRSGNERERSRKSSTPEPGKRDFVHRNSVASALYRSGTPDTIREHLRP